MSKKGTGENLTYLKPTEVKNIIKMFLKRNQVLQSEGHLPNSLCFIGEAGISKTSVAIQTAEELNIPISKINLATLDDLGDLVGFPLKTYEMHKEVGGKDERVWYNEKQYDVMVTTGWNPTGNVRTDYAPPKWVTNLDHADSNILLLDDYNRCDARFNQAIMDLIDRGEYYGWELPKGTTIILTGNPSDGDYFTSQEDQAQITRYFRFGVHFNIDDWAEYAENVGLDGRCINFMLRYWDQVIPNSSGTTLKTNPRQWSKFFNAIGGLGDFNNPATLATIQMIGKAIVGDYVNTFTIFINHKLDKLIEPKRMLFDKDTKAVIKEMKGIIGDIKTTSGSNKYRAEIASILATRLSNYTIRYVNDNPLTDAMCDRLEDICKEKVFSEDLNFKIFRDSFGNNMKKFEKLIVRPHFYNYVIG